MIGTLYLYVYRNSLDGNHAGICQYGTADELVRLAAELIRDDVDVIEVRIVDGGDFVNLHWVADVGIRYPGALAGQPIWAPKPERLLS